MLRHIIATIPSKWGGWLSCTTDEGLKTELPQRSVWLYNLMKWIMVKCWIHVSLGWLCAVIVELVPVAETAVMKQHDRNSLKRTFYTFHHRIIAPYLKKNLPLFFFYRPEKVFLLPFCISKHGKFKLRCTWGLSRFFFLEDKMYLRTGLFTRAAAAPADVRIIVSHFLKPPRCIFPKPRVIMHSVGYNIS